MENEWLDVAYINFDRAIMHGQVVRKQQYEGFYISSEVEIEQVLTTEQRRQVEDLNHKQSREMRELLRSFIDD